jgi:hypothetical protein
MQPHFAFCNCFTRGTHSLTRLNIVHPGDYAPFWALRSRFVTHMFARGRALHSRNGWGFAAGGDGDGLPGNFLVVPR